TLLRERAIGQGARASLDRLPGALAARSVAGDARSARHDLFRAIPSWQADGRLGKRARAAASSVARSSGRVCTRSTALAGGKPSLHSRGSRKYVRHHRRQHLSRRLAAGPVVLHAAAASVRAVRDADSCAVPVWSGHAPGRRRDRCSRVQRGTPDPVRLAARMSGARAVPVRYRILGVLFVLSFVNYLLRNNLSIAIPSIQEEFGFTNAELGWILGSFNFSYALLQIPGGIFGQVYGPRRALTFMALSWGVLTFLTGFVPALMAASATGAMVSLLVIRVFLGATNAPLFPITAGAFANWFPAGRWAFPNAALSVGLVLGQAAIGPIVSLLIVKYGWRESFYIFAPLGLLIGAWWYWYGRDQPAQHPAITAEEVRLIEGDQPRREPETRERSGWRHMLVHRDVL